MLPRLRRGLVGLIAGVGLMLAGGLVLAQDAGPPASAPTATPGSEGTVPPAKRKSISAADMTRQAQGLMDKMKDALRRVVQLQELARRKTDVIKLNCVNDKLLQLKQLLNIAEDASTNMQEAIARSDEDGRYHEFGRISYAQEQAASLVSEAENCMGEDVTFIGPTQIIVEGGKEPDDPTVTDAPRWPSVVDLPMASPFI